jgi:hypothetical protein
MMSWPVVNAAPGELSQSTALAISSGVPMRPTGVCVEIVFFTSVSPWVRPHSESYEKRPNSRPKSVTGPMEAIFEHNGKFQRTKILRANKIFLFDFRRSLFMVFRHVSMQLQNTGVYSC